MTTFTQPFGAALLLISVLFFQAADAQNRERVKREMDAGASIDEIKRKVGMAEFEDWGSYRDWVELNVEGMYRYLRESSRK